MNVIRYGIASKTATYWNLYVAQREGFYAREGLDVVVSVTGGTRESIDALLDGSADLVGCSPDELVSANERGADLVILGGIVLRPVSWIVAQPAFARLDQLRGRRIGVNQTRGSVSMVFRAALRRAGLGLQDYEQVPVGSTPAMAEALRQGHVDAAMLTAPFDQNLMQAGFTGLLNVGEQYPCYAFTTVNARRSWALEHTAEVSAFFRATRLAGERIAASEHRAASLAALQDETGLQGDALLASYNVYTQPGVLSRAGEVSVDAVQAVIQAMEEEGLLEVTPPGPAALIWRVQDEADGSAAT